MNFKVIAIFILASLLFSCGPKISEEQGEKLSSLSSSVDSIAIKVNQLDSSQIATMIDQYFTHRIFLQKQMKDTLSRELIFKLDEYMKLRKGMGYIQAEYLDIKDEARLMQKQMVDLNKDIDNRLINKEKFDKYYALELENFKQLEFASDRLINAEKNMTPAFAKQYPFIDSLIKAYKIRVNE